MLLFTALATAILLPAQRPEAPRRETVEPDPRRLVRDLIDDDIPGNAERAMELLRRSDGRTREALQAGIYSADGQQRFLSAVALAQIGADEVHRAWTFGVLLSHLGKNQVGGDMEMAQQAMVELAERHEEVVAWVREARATCYGQQLLAVEGVSLRLGLHRDWSLAVPYPSSRYRFALQQHQQIPVVKPRVPQWNRERQALEWVLQMGADEVRRNAMSALNDAMRGLQEREVRRALTKALMDPERQRRQFVWVAWVRALQQGDWGWAPQLPKDEVPYDLLDEMALEALAHDDLDHRVGLSNCGIAAYYFADRGSQAWGTLRRGFLSADPVQRTRAAVLACAMGDPQVDGFLPILVAALRDNKVRNDAVAAGLALRSVGEPAVGWLESFGPPLDGQERRLRARIVADCLEMDLDERQEMGERAKYRVPSIGN